MKRLYSEIDHEIADKIYSSPQISPSKIELDFLYAHVVNSSRVGNPLEKFTSREIKHINSTLLIIDSGKKIDDSRIDSGKLDTDYESRFPKINTYANQDWKGFPIIMIEGAVFFGGFHRDIGSGGYFSGRIISEFKPELMFDIAKWLKNKEGNVQSKSSTWGEQSLDSMAKKIFEINKMTGPQITRQ
jgi:hypothetical protein